MRTALHIPLLALALAAPSANAEMLLPQVYLPEVAVLLPMEHSLTDAVRVADFIFTGSTKQLDTSKRDDNVGKGRYTGTIAIKEYLKGNLNERELTLEWDPSATGIEPGSTHIFFVRSKDGKYEVVKEIFIHEPPYMCCRTYGAYDGGTEATLQSIRLLVDRSEPVPEYAATLLADLKQTAPQRKSTAVMLACETLRAECLEPLLYAVSKCIYYHQAIQGACLLDGNRGASVALALALKNPADQHRIFAAIAAARNPKSVPALDRFGTEHPKYRVSCAFAIHEIDAAKLADTVRRWRVDGKHAGIKHTITLSSWDSGESFSADELLHKALVGSKVLPH